MKKIFVLSLLFFNIFLFGQTDFENSFLQGYLNFEKAFQLLGGDYGTTFFPLLNYGYGGRDLALSGAFTAVADDITTLELNPAGTASLKYTEIFFSHNKLMADVNYNTIAYTMRLNDLGFGLGTRILYIPFTHYDSFGEDVANGIISYTVITFNVSYNFLRKYEFFGLSVGGNFKLYIYGVPENIYPSQTSVNIAFDFGLLTRFNFLKAYKSYEKNFSIGLAIKNLGPFTYNEPPPTAIAVGIGYKPIEQILISIDFNMMINYSELTYKNWNVRTGFEWKFTKVSSLLFGVLISSSPSFSLGVNLDFDDFSITATYNPDLIDVSRFSVSATLKLGDLGRSKKEAMLRKLYSDALKLMAESKYGEAKEILEFILKKDPGFTPAKISLENCNYQLKLEKEIKNIYENQNKLQ